MELQIITPDEIEEIRENDPRIMTEHTWKESDFLYPVPKLITQKMETFYD